MPTEQQSPIEDVNNDDDDVAADANDEISNATINGSNSTTIPSNNELPEESTNGLKRSLQLNESDDDNYSKKKFKPIENNGQEQLENNSGSNEHVVKNNIDEHSYVSKEMPEDKNETSSNFDNHFDVEANNVGADDLKTIHLSDVKIGYLNNENTLCTKNNIDNKRIPIISRVMKSTKIQDNSSENNGNKCVQYGHMLSKMSFSLNRSRSLSSLDTLVLLDKSDDDIVNAYDNSKLAGSSGIVKKSESFNKLKTKELENNVSSETKDDESDNDNNNDVDGQDETVNISSNEDDDNDDFPRITLDSNSDDVVSDNDNNINDDDNNDTSGLTDEQIMDVVKLAKQISRKNFAILLNLFSSKKLTYDKFESFCTQIICSVMTEKFNIGNYRRDVQKLEDREITWRLKFELMSRELKELISVIHLHRAALKDNIYAKPHIITRTVGLQTVGDSSYARLQKIVQPTTSDSVDITSEDDDDVVGSNIENFKPSTSSNSEVSPLKKISPLPCVSKQMPILLPKTAVPSSLPLNSVINNDDLLATIDLTDCEESVTTVPPSRVSLEKSPIKLIPRSTLNTNVSTGSSVTQLNRNMTAKISPKSVTYIEVPKLHTSNSGFIVRTTSTATGSNPLTSVVSNLNMTRNARPYIFRDGKLLPVQLSSVNPRQLPIQSNAVSIATRQLPTAQLTGSLQPVPAAIPITAAAAAIPITAAAVVHPAPLPGIPNQRSLPTWKKLPPAPIVTLTNNADAPSSKALVLSWNLNLTKMTADITAYQIYAYHETPEVPRSELWKKIGEVNALPLPMACSLTQFVPGEKYYFAVRAVDIYTRVGPFSSPQSAYLIY